MKVEKIVFSGILIAIGVILPIIFHLIPGNIGLIILPIHYSAYLAGGFFGPIIGLCVGCLTPILSYFITGMPNFPMFIIISLETACYGLIFGFLYYKKKYNIYISFVTSMISGRLVNFINAYFIANLLFAQASQAFQLGNILYNFSIGLIGASIQFLVIPIVIKRVNQAFPFDNNFTHIFNYLKPNKTCVLINNSKIIYESNENSIKPLIKYLLENGIPNENTILIDKIVGIAIANVILYCNIKTVYTQIISKPALDLLKNNQVDVYFEKLVDNILRYDKVDICPMEKKLLTINSPQEAVSYLKTIVLNNEA